MIKEQLGFLVEKNIFNSQNHIAHKNEQKCFRIYVKVKNLNLLEDSIDVHLCSLEVGNDFLDRIQKVLIMKGKK